MILAYNLKRSYTTLFNGGEKDFTQPLQRSYISMQMKMVDIDYTLH